MKRNRATEILERLAETLGVRTDTELAKALDTAGSTISNWKSRDSVPFTKCEEVARKYNVSLDWLILGKGSPCISELVHGVELTPRQQALLTLFNDLSEEAQREILQDAEKKKRLLDLEKRVLELEEGGSTNKKLA